MNTFVRSLSLFAIAAGAFALAGCEDNPDQFFKVAPKGAGQLWNDGKTAPYSDAARNSFNDNFNQVSKDELCAGPVKHDVWSKMVNQPIIPSSTHGMTMAGINLAGGDSWTGLKFSDAQKTLCQAVPIGADATTLQAAWGDAQEVQTEYLINNNTIDFMQLNQGYRGTLDFAARPTDINDPTKPNPFGTGPGGKPHTYKIGVGVPVLRDGQVWPLDWSNNGANFAKQATEMFDALMYTYAPELTSTQTDCSAAQSCLARPTGGGTAVFGARPLGIYMFIPSITTPQPGPSTPSYLYAFYVKLMPFSGASMFLKLDEEGPIAEADGLGDKTPKTNCIQKLGMTYGSFLDTCVNVLQDPTKNQATATKLLGGFAHDKETYNFTVQGIDSDFASSLIGDDKIVGDDWRPDPKDTAFHFNMDIRATGKLLNEYSEDQKTFTFGATGAIYREFARRAQADIQLQQKAFDPSFQGHDLGDQACLMTATPAANLGDPPTVSDPKTWKPAAGCTGFEGFVTPADPTTTTVTPGVRKLSLGAKAQGLGFVSALKPGDPIAMFCSDPTPNPDGLTAGAACTSNAACQSLQCNPGDTAGSGSCEDPLVTLYQHCGSNDLVGLQGSIFDGPFQRVISYLGGGNPLRVAPALRDRKYYFQHFGYAITKYLLAAGNSPRPTNLNEDQYGPTGTACGGRTCEPNVDHLQFDQVGSTGDSATFEYIDRRWADHGKDPISFEYQILILSGNQQETRFRQHLDRDERAAFKVMAQDESKPVTDEANNLRITNIIGSSIISAGPWTAASDTKDAYYCATTPGPDGKGDPDCLSAGGPLNAPPSVGGVMELDDNRQPLLTAYKGAFTGTPLSLGTNYIKKIQEQPNNEALQVQMPNFKDPYDLSQGTDPTPGAKILPDWRPLAPGAGFPIPVNGMRDRFVPAAAIDMSGQNLSANLDYAEQESDHTLKILAAEAQTFEGEIFLCQDPITHDLLHVKQYDSIADVQAWIDKHPGVQDACDMFIRLSGSGSDPVQVLAKQAGITATVGQGSGVGRIIDILFYDPTL